MVLILQHSSDVKRLQILSTEGGITLDSDTFVVRKLNEFFDLDCTIGWPKNQSIGNQVSFSKPIADVLMNFSNDSNFTMLFSLVSFLLNFKNCLITRENVKVI